MHHSTDMTSKLASLVFISVAVVLAGCGGEETGELPTESAQAALVSYEISDTLTPLYQLHGETAGLLPKTAAVNALGAGELSKLVTGIRSHLGQAAANRCAKVQEIDQRSYQVTFTDCSYGSQGGLQLDGAVTLTWSFDKASNTATISSGFASFQINGRQIDGEMTTTFQAGEAQGELAMELSLQLTDQLGEQKELTLAGSVINDRQGGQVTIAGVGAVTQAGITTSVAMEDVVISYGDRAPHTGSITLSSAQTVQVIFSGQTVTDGLVTLVINGKDMGQWSWQDVMDLLSGK